MTFMDLEDPRYAYMFGFLQADGNLYAGAGQKERLSVEISHRDIGILQEFQKLTPYTSTITERTRATNFAQSHRSARWTVYSLEVRNRLVEAGLPYGPKSTKITPPRVPFSRPDYLRGIIDADGSIGHTGKGLPFVGLTTASSAIAAYVCHYFKRTQGIQRRPGRNTRDCVYNVLYTREAGVTVAKHLYYPGSLALDRKRESAARVSSWVRPDDMGPARNRRPWMPMEDRFLLEAPTLAHAAERLERSVKSCQARRWRLRQDQQSG
ncbi:LAGLIDADG family homing endonuclease [Streptomyces sp. P1-3]|uniref:LAGLIDADG family homing endonuclease n=1 Tax=Streptomyces sp. P1-3 TaxID=3421658 RepID=UPI003D362B9E